MEDVSITVVGGASASGISGRPCISGIPWVADVPTVPHVLVDHHIVVELPNICARELVHMGSVELADGVAAHGMNVPASNEANGIAARIIDISHERSFLVLGTTLGAKPVGHHAGTPSGIARPPCFGGCIRIRRHFLHVTSLG